MKIANVRAREILDSRGTPTVEVEVELALSLEVEVVLVFALDFVSGNNDGNNILSMVPSVWGSLFS